MRIQSATGAVAALMGVLSVGTAAEADLAERLHGLARVKKGICAHVGVTDGKLTAALSGEGRWLVHGLALDEQTETVARAHIRSAGIYGQVSVEQFDGVRLPYADDMVNLIVLSRAADLMAKRLEATEIIRVLAPDGVACFEDATVAKAPGSSVIEGPPGWSAVHKLRPEGMDDFPQHNYDARCNRVSRDIHAGPTWGIRWIGGVDFPVKNYGTSQMVASGGRVFYVRSEIPDGGGEYAGVLSARDAYNGLLLWKRGAMGLLIASEKRLYGHLGRKMPLAALDAETGELVKTYKDAGRPASAVLYDGYLYMCSGARYGKNLMCVNADTGKIRWRIKRGVYPSGSIPNFVIDGNELYFFDHERKGKKRELGCLDLETGEEKWHVDISGVLPPPEKRTGLAMHACGDGVLMIGEGEGGEGVHAFSSKDGKHLWTYKYGLVYSGRGARHKGSSYNGGCFIDGLYWVHIGHPRREKGGNVGAESWRGLDPKTGREVKVYPYTDAKVGDSCYRCQATMNYFMGGHSLFVDTRTGKFCPRAPGIHATCRFGMLPANGLMTVCGMYTDTYVRGDMGLVTRDRIVTEPDPRDGPRLVKGPAYGRPWGEDAADTDWPRYRYDGVHSSRTPAPAPMSLAPLWAKELGRSYTRADGDCLRGDLSAPTVAGGMVYLAALDELEVVALKADTGEIAWRFTPGGRVKIPPSYCKGFVFFGCGDGNVYCLAAQDGRLAWRFRAARARCLVHVRGRLESIWPVHTGIQVIDDVACFAAGREGTIDGGVDVYAVRADTGDIVWTKRWTRGPVVRLMVGDGKSIAGFGEKAAFSLKNGAGKRLPRLSSAAYYPSIVDLKHMTNMEDAALGRLATLQIRALARAEDVVVASGFRRQARDRKKRSKRAPRAFRDGRETEPVPSEYFLWLFSTDDGTQLAERKLDSPPIFNSLAVAGGRAYLATRDGRLRCFGAE